MSAVATVPLCLVFICSSSLLLSVHGKAVLLRECGLSWLTVLIYSLCCFTYEVSDTSGQTRMFVIWSGNKG